MQLMNQQILEEILTSMFKTHVEQPATELTLGEQNVLRHICLWICEVNDESFLLFKEIEKAMQVRLRTHLEQGVDATVRSSRRETLGVVKSDVNDLFFWDVVSDSIQNDEWKAELLTAIISMWLTIRGYSITSQWMEQHKHLSCVNSKIKKGLCKELKKL